MSEPTAGDLKLACDILRHLDMQLRTNALAPGIAAIIAKHRSEERGADFTWTTDPPTQPGWYLIRRKPFDHRWMYRMDPDGGWNCSIPQRADFTHFVGPLAPHYISPKDMPKQTAPHPPANSSEIPNGSSPPAGDFGEPWQAYVCPEYQTVTMLDKESEEVVVVDDEARCKRVVACVNLLAGIAEPEPALRELVEAARAALENFEGGGLYDLERALQHDIQVWDRLRAALAPFAKKGG